MRRALSKMVNGLLGRFGYYVGKLSEPPRIPPDMERAFAPYYEKVRPYSMTPVEPMYELYKAVRYVSMSGVAGDIVECGVWKGGTSMLAALLLIDMNDTERVLYLYDTFAGMAEPTDRDRDMATQEQTYDKWKRLQQSDVNLWCYSPIDEVFANMAGTGYPRERLRLVKGKVEETIPATIPERIALLRLDTDWYDSTYHEMKHLFPRLQPGGVLIVDDYDQWTGSREAVDQYLREQRPRILLHRIPNGGCIAIKQQ